MNKQEIIETIKMSFGIDEEFFIDKTPINLFYTYRILDNFFNHTEITSILKFIEYNEKKRIENNDITTYKSFEDLS